MVETLKAVLLHGLSLPDIALFLVRLTVGVFFLLARFRWVWDPAQHINCNSSYKGEWFPTPRHSSLENKLYHCGYSASPLLAGSVAIVELLAALALIAGLLTVPAAFGLAVVLIFATICTAKEKVMKQNPIDGIDCVCCYLWLVEPLYLLLVTVIMFCGPGRYSLDWFLLR